jgi:hypothetical protein
MMMRQEMDYRTLVFWPDGHLFDGTPRTGTAPPNAAALLAKGESHLGVYDHQGDKLLLTFADGSTETLTADGETWSDGTKTLSLVAPLADGAVLNGSISSFFYTGFTPGSGVEGGISSSSTTTFFPDGSYSGSSFGGASGNFDGGVGYTVSNERGHDGKYQIKDGLLTMIPADGSPARDHLALQVGDKDILIGDQFLETAN